MCGNEEQYEPQEVEEMGNSWLRRCQECWNAAIRLQLVAERAASWRRVKTSVTRAMP